MAASPERKVAPSSPERRQSAQIHHLHPKPSRDPKALRGYFVIHPDTNAANDKREQVLTKLHTRNKHALKGGILSPAYQAGLSTIYGENPTVTKPVLGTGVLDPRYLDRGLALERERRLERTRDLARLEKEGKPVQHWFRKYVFNIPMFRGAVAALAFSPVPAIHVANEMAAHSTQAREAFAYMRAQMSQESAERGEVAGRVLRGEAADEAHMFIDSLWKTKEANRISRGSGTKERRTEVSTMLREALDDGRVHRLSLENELRTSMGLRPSGYHERGIMSVMNGEDTFDWRRFALDLRLSDKQRASTERISRLVSEEMLESVFLNETMASGSGDENVTAWEATLRQVGEGIALHPTLGDKYDIVGPGQETLTLADHQAVGSTSQYLRPAAYWFLNLPDGFTDNRSVEDQNAHRNHRTELETDARIPRSLQEERLEVALNARRNLADAALTPATEQALNLIADQIEHGTGDEKLAGRTRLAEYIGMAHNDPAGAQAAFIRWYRAGHHMNSPLYQFATDNGNVHDYGMRMTQNFPAMLRFGEHIRANVITLPSDTERFNHIRQQIRTGEF